MGLIEIYMLLFSCSVASESLEPHGLQHARLPCPSPPTGACSNSCPSSQWCHPAISSSVVPFSCLQSFPASGSFPMSQLFASHGQSIGASASVLPMNIQDWFPLGWTGWISLQSRDSRESSPAPQFKRINTSVLSLLYNPNIISTHDYWRNYSLNYMDFVGKVMSLFFNAPSRFVIAFLPRSKHLLISWLQSLSTVILVSTVSPPIYHEVMGPDAMIFLFWMLSFKPAFSFSSFTPSRASFNSASLYAIRVVSSAYLSLLILLPTILIPACASSSPAFLMMYSAEKLNKQGDKIQPWCTPFPILN